MMKTSTKQLSSEYINTELLMSLLQTYCDVSNKYHSDEIVDPLGGPWVLFMASPQSPIGTMRSRWR